MSIEALQPEPPKEPGPIVIDGISYLPSSVLLTGIPKISFKDNSSFGVVDDRGESARVYSQGSELGIYYDDTRYLSVWEMTFNGVSPVALTHELRFGGETVVFSMSNPDMPMLGNPLGRIPRDTLLFRRVFSLISDTLFESVEIKNFDHRPHELQIEQWVGGRFDDIFEVRGFPRPRRGRMLPATEEEEAGGGRTTVLSYEGLDRRVRRVFVQRLFPAEKIRLSPSLAGYFSRVVIPPKGTVSLKTIASFDKKSDGTFLERPFSRVEIPEKMELLQTRSITDPFSGLSFDCDNAIINRSIRNAQTDIFMLLTRDRNELLYPYAGVPWFSAPFGRDGIITAYQLLPWYPNIAKGVLEYAFTMLGDTLDPFTDEQPGKVFHELRKGEMAHTREVPFIPYYGSVDSTPLALILLHEYVRWTMDLESLRKWWPEALRALAWIERWGDTDRDGFVEYAKQSPNGLVNQGWKDSNDSIMHSDGTLAQAPIRLCEVQAYAFRARMAMSQLARLQGKFDLSSRLRLEALRLKALFSERFWDSRRKFVYLALAGKEGNICDVLSSNMGHCLWGEILDAEQARHVADHLMSNAMFSGYGVRTLADTEVAYNPLSYHNGSVWPHDNSLIMEGFRNYGFNEELTRLAIALMDVLETSEDFRLPELFCGFRKRANTPPVPYQVACKPQAWAAGSIFLMLKSMLGVSMDVDQRHLVLNAPTLSPKIKSLFVRGLRGRDWELDILFRSAGRGTVVDVVKKTGDVRVLIVK